MISESGSRTDEWMKLGDLYIAEVEEEIVAKSDFETIPKALEILTHPSSAPLDSSLLEKVGKVQQFLEEVSACLPAEEAKRCSVTVMKKLDALRQKILDFSPEDRQALLEKNRGLLLDYREKQQELLKSWNPGPDVLKVIPLEFKSDEWVTFAVHQDGLALKDATIQQQNNPKIVQAALSQNGNALQFAGEHIKNSPQFVSIAIQTTPGALQYASAAIKKDKEYLLSEIKTLLTKEGVHSREAVATLIDQADDSIKADLKSEADRLLKPLEMKSFWKKLGIIAACCAAFAGGTVLISGLVALSLLFPATSLIVVGGAVLLGSLLFFTYLFYKE